MNKDTCPRCGAEFFEEEDEILICPTCGREGCTLNCIPSGRGTECLACEEGTEDCDDDE